MKKFKYEILLTTQYATEEAWLNLICGISKLNGFLKKWKIFVKIELNEVRYFVVSAVNLPPVINSQGDFLIKPTEEEFEKISFKRSMAYYLSTKYPCILDIFDRNESHRNRKLKLTEISFRAFKRDNFFSSTTLFFEKINGKVLRKKGLFNIPHTFLSIDFTVHSRFFHQKDAIKYLDIRKSLHLLTNNDNNSVLKVDTFPYLADDYYLNIHNYDFDRHSVIMGSSGTGKSKFISSLITDIAKVPEYRENYKVVMIDPHNNIKNDIGGLDGTKILDFKTLENSIDLFAKTSKDEVVTTELFMSLFENLMGAMFNSKLERVLRHSIHLLLIRNMLTFTNLRRLILEMEYRNEVLSNGEIPSSITDFFLSDFNELKSRSYPEAIAPIIAFIDEMQMLPSFNYEDKQESLKETIENNFLTIFSLDQTKIGEKVTKTISGLVMQSMLQLVQSYSFDEHIIFIIDEVAVIENPIIKRFLSEARKYNLSLVLAGQYFSQISEDLRKAIFANVINYYVFRVARQDALLLENNIQMEVGVKNSYIIRMKMLTELNNRDCIARVSKNGIMLPAFKARTMNFDPNPPRVINQILRTTMLKNNKEPKNISFNTRKKSFSIGNNVDIGAIMISQSSSRRRLENNG